jgi:hypothetical protein
MTFSFPLGRSERPDFICRRSDGIKVGIEVVRVIRDPDSAFWTCALDGAQFDDPMEAATHLQEVLYRKEKKRSEPDCGAKGHERVSHGRLDVLHGHAQDVDLGEMQLGHEAMMIITFPTRELAIAWAEHERKAIEADVAGADYDSYADLPW